MMSSLFHRARSIWILGAVLSAMGCAAAPPATKAPSTARAAPLSAAPGELRMRHPDEVASSETRTRGLGVLQPVYPVRRRPASESQRAKVAGRR